MNRSEKRLNTRALAKDISKYKHGTLTLKEREVMVHRIQALEQAGIIKVRRRTLKQGLSLFFLKLRRRLGYFSPG